MKIDNQTFKHLEKLAKITIEDSDKETATLKIQNILTLLDSIDEKVLDNISPLHHPLEIHQQLREDCPIHQVQPLSIEKNAPAVQDNLFLVPKVIE